MSRFELAIETVLSHEGGLSTDERDPGGTTNFGISLRFARSLGLDLDIDGDGDVDSDDIRKLSRAKAIQVYRAYFWDRHRIHRVVDQTVATKLFDLSVNMGNRRAVMLLQRATRSLQISNQPLVDDGVFGPMTEATVDRCSPRDLMPAFRSEAAGFYRGLALQSPNLEWALKGWLNRAYS